MRIALFDHPYHRTTRSSQFFLQMLESLGDVSTFYVEDNGALDKDVTFEEVQFDLIVIWQVHQAFRLLSGRHPNVVFVPMYDAMQTRGGFYWKEEFARAKVLSFSRKLHEEVIARGAVSLYAQYFPNPSQFRPISDYSDIRAFFWFRREPVDLSLVLQLIGQVDIAQLTIHNAPDPGMRAQRIPAAPANIRALKSTDWAGDRDRYRALLREHNMFFAPRILEGIGMSFLEAMALGQCVVAPHASTMNEYIANGTNGILYSLNNLFPADFSRIAEQGKRARESIERGYRRWTAQREALLTFLSPESAKRKVDAHAQVAAVADAKMLPKVSVVTVCLNAGADLEPTLRNVLDQDYPDLEYLVIDGGSDDGSIEVIKRHVDRLAHWHSQKDAGVYHAMNEAVRKCTGEFILFMNAGDSFTSNDALSRFFADVPADTDIIYGHHLYVTAEGHQRYHPAADFETTWQRLKNGQLSHDWLSGIPGHQATAVRGSLLSKLWFDTSYRIAADHDLLFRARDGCARFYNADELVSLYRGGGLSAKNRALCHYEWRQIAAKFAPPEDVARFYDMLDRDNRAAPASSAFSKLSDMLGWIAIRLSPSRRATLLEKVPLQGAPITAPAYSADKFDRIDFSCAGVPNFLLSLQGVSDIEGWGRWTIGKRVEFHFREELPFRFQLVLECFGSGDNIGNTLIVRAGGGEAEFGINASPAVKHRIVVQQKEPSHILSFEVPSPKSPAELWPGKSHDKRDLGIGLVSLRLLPVAHPALSGAGIEKQYAALAQEEISYDIARSSTRQEELQRRLEDQMIQIGKIRDELRETQDIAITLLAALNTEDDPRLNDERHITGWISLGQQRLSHKKPDEARFAFLRAAEAAGDYPHQAVKLIEYLTENGQWDFAEEIVNGLAETEAFFAAASVLVGAQSSAGKQAAQSLLERLRANGAAEKLIHLFKAQILAANGELSTAGNEVGRALEIDGASLNAHRYAIALKRAVCSDRAAPRLQDAPAVKLLQIAPFTIALPEDHPLDSYLKDWHRYSQAPAQILSTLALKYANLTAIDVGANIGDSAAMFRSQVNCPILCVEGHPAFLPYLNHNAALIGPGITIEPAFLASRTGNIEIGRNSAAAGTASLSNLSDKDCRHTVTVPLETMDAILQRHPAFLRSKFLKVDADGYDFDILLGAKQFLTRAHPVVFFEFDPCIEGQPSAGKDAISSLLKLGYSRLLAFDNFGNPLAKVEQDVPRRIEELTRYLGSNRRNGTAVHYLDICAVHDDDADIFDKLAERSGFLEGETLDTDSSDQIGQGENFDDAQ